MIEHNKITLGKQEQQAVSKVLDSGYIAQGKEVEKFENEFSDFLGLPEQHAVALSSGTSALFMSLWSLKAKHKSIAMPVYVCSSLRNAVAMVQANELLLDNAIDSPNISLNQLKKSNADFAIIPHMFGLPNQIQNINNIDIIEDCAQSLGASIGNEKTGLIGKAGIFSFYATKLMTSGGQGGMFVSKDKNLVDKVRDYREFDYRRDKKERFNFQMTDIQASIGRVQLRKLPSFLERRKEIFALYKESGLDLISSENNSSVYYRAVIRINDPARVKDKLLKQSIKTIIPIEDWELLGDVDNFKNAYNLTQTTLSLPIYPLLTNKEVKSIINQVGEAIQ
ncbi:DegT/DnrJ/EryC1/StrS aminotransferase family protein [Candidatus Thioglobus sp.]|nr:DegT/DnrJ/EryC1/StrS aminotransferase family protein [Candidatus Thioglobus sp.]